MTDNTADCEITVWPPLLTAPNTPIVGSKVEFQGLRTKTFKETTSFQTSRLTEMKVITKLFSPLLSIIQCNDLGNCCQIFYSPVIQPILAL